MSLELPEERELVGLLLTDLDDDAGAALNAWRVVADALRLEDVELRPASHEGMHPARTAEVVAGGTVLGVVGELDPETLQEYGLVQPRAGWLELDLQKLAAAPRRPLAARPVSRFPSSDVDLAFVVDDSGPCGGDRGGARSPRRASCASPWSCSTSTGGPAVREGSRSLAYRLRFCALDRTLTDGEVAGLRSQCIAAVETKHRATLRS